MVCASPAEFAGRSNNKDIEKETQHRPAHSASADGLKLKYDIHNEQHVLRFEVIAARAGRLDRAGPTTKSSARGAQIVAGLTAGAEADDDGRSLLAALHRCGVLIARSVDSVR